MADSTLPDATEKRKADHPVEPLFLKRWSPRAMSEEKISSEELNQLFEAARWAPSTYNEQEWRYSYSWRGSDSWDTFFSFLVEANQAWCKNASVLIVVFSRKEFTKNGNPNPVHTFDSGASFQNLCLQGASMGLVVHGMAGFDQDKVRKELSVPEVYAVEAMIAVGKHGDPSSLPDELAARESPSDRNPISEFTAEGSFPFK